MTQSLLQHHGGRSADGRKVELILVLVDPNPNPVLADSATCGIPTRNEPHSDGKVRPVLHRIYRRPAGSFGVWVGFRYNGETHYPDLSVPISLFDLPRDAERVPLAEAFRYWTT
jgi:hypothetical protein